jgi:hypothetical protein
VIHLIVACQGKFNSGIERRHRDTIHLARLSHEPAVVPHRHCSGRGRVVDRGCPARRAGRASVGRRCQHPKPAGLRAGPAVITRPRAQRPGLLRRPREAEPLLGHGRHLPVGVPDHPGRRRAVRRARDHRPQPAAGHQRDRRRQRGKQLGDAPCLLAPPRRPCRRVLVVRQGRRAHRARGDPAPTAA